MEFKNVCPWGYYQVLSDAPDHKVKRIVVLPGGSLSLQRHKLRQEHWYCVSGEGEATVEGNHMNLVQGQSVNIAQGAIHRLENTSDQDLVIIEVQTGAYFGEDDIERLEDNYGRV